MEVAVRELMAIALVVIGLSHTLQPGVWVKFFVMLRRNGKAGVLTNALLHLCPGALIVVFHNVWKGVPAILTIYAWLLVIKSTIYLLRPSIGLRALALVSEEQPRRFAFVGLPMILLGLLLARDVAPSGPG